MSIEYNAVVMVGRPRKDFTPEQLEELLDGDVLEFCTPTYDYYDANSICGFSYSGSPDYGASEFRWDQEKINRLCAKFQEATGLEAKVWLTPWGY